MTSISNKYLFGQIITANERDDTIDACFDFFQLNSDATKETVKREYGRFCLRFHPDKNSSPSDSKVTKIPKQAKRYIDDHFYFIDIQVIEIHDSDYDSGTEKTHKKIISKEKCKANIKVLHLGDKFKDTEKYLMLTDNWLDLQTSHNEHISTLARELENLFHYDANTSM